MFIVNVIRTNLTKHKPKFINQENLCPINILACFNSNLLCFSFTGLATTSPLPAVISNGSSGDASGYVNPIVTHSGAKSPISGATSGKSTPPSGGVALPKFSTISDHSMLYNNDYTTHSHALPNGGQSPVAIDEWIKNGSSPAVSSVGNGYTPHAQ